MISPASTITRGSWVAIHDRADGPFHVLDIKRGWLKAARLDYAEVSAPLASDCICSAPAKHDCNSPIWRYLSGKEWPALKDSQQWICLNCPLHAAIYLNRDDVARVRLLALIDETRAKAGERR